MKYEHFLVNWIQCFLSFDCLSKDTKAKFYWDELSFERVILTYHWIHKSEVCILNRFPLTPCCIFSFTFHLLSISKGSSLDRGMVKNEFANIWVIYPVADRREIQEPWFQFPLKSHRVTAIQPIYYKFIAAIPRLSLRGC